jgi:hypothetical protein
MAMPDGYIKALLQIPASSPVSQRMQALIEGKRAHLNVKRILKEQSK